MYALGISNIRVIKKIERAVAQSEPTLKTFDPLVFDQAVQSLSLLGWSVFERSWLHLWSTWNRNEVRTSCQGLRRFRRLNRHGMRCSTPIVGTE